MTDKVKMILETNEGIIELESNCLLVFIDETGGESLTDPNCPIFGLGGCATLVSEYERLMKNPWIFMKNEVFDGADKNLHATDLGKLLQERVKEERDYKISVLNCFFTKFIFSRFAVTLGKNTLLDSKIEPYQITARALWERIRDISKCYPFTSMAIIFEDSQRGNELSQKYFSGYKINRNGKAVITKLCIMAKDTLEPGLEIADFVIHTAGRQARLMNKDQTKPKFQLVLTKYSKKLINGGHHFFILPIQRTYNRKLLNLGTR